MKGRACQTLAALPRPPSAPARRGSPGRRRTSVWARALPDMQRGGRTMAAATVGDRRRRRRSSSAHARRGEWYRPLTRPPAPPPPRPAEPPTPTPPPHTARPAGTGSPHRTPSEGRRLPAAAGQPHGRRDPSAPAGRRCLPRDGAGTAPVGGTGREPVGPGAARGPRPPSLRGHRTLPRGRAHRKTRGMTGLPVCGCPFPKRRIARRSLRSLLLTGCR